MDAEPQHQYVVSAALLAVFATPWGIAGALLWRRWRARVRERRSATDGPGRLLAAAAGTLPEDRREWGAAMTAELAQLGDRASRWWFALGCARVAVFPPRCSRVPVLAVGALAAAAVATAGLGVGHALPAMRVFAVTFVALVGALATLAVAGSRRLRPAASAGTMTAAGLAGVAGTIALTAYVLANYPTAVEALQPGNAVFFAVVLAGCVWLSLTPPKGLTTSRLARRLGAGAALALGVGFLLASRLVIDPEPGMLLYLLPATVAIFFAGSAAAAAVSRSFRAGVQAAVWSALLGTLLIFVIGLPEALHWYGADGRLHLDGEQFHPVGQNLIDYIVLLALLPAWGLPFGVIGAAVGTPGRRGVRACEPRDLDPQSEARTITR